MENTTLPELLSIQEVADFLRVHHNTIRRHIARGDLPAVKVVGVFRIRREDVLRLLELTGGGPDDDAA